MTTINAILQDGSNVDMPALRAYLADLEAALAQANSIIATGTVAALVGDRVYATRSALYADLVPADNLFALVYNDTDPLKNGLYQKDGATTAGDWDGPFDLFASAAEGLVQPLVDAAETARDEAEAARDEAVAAVEGFGTGATLTADADPSRSAKSPSRVTTQDADYAADLRARGYAANLAQRAFQGMRASVFADINGSNANAGTSLPLAKQGLSNAAALLTGAGSIGIAEASFFRDRAYFDEDGNGLYSVGATGAIPVISGADLVTGFTAQGTTDVWQKSIAFENASDLLGKGITERMRVYKNGALLTRVANISACSSTPNSFVDVKRSDGTPVTIYINVGAGANPSSFNIEVITRHAAITSSGGMTVRGPIIMEKGMSNNGALYLEGESDVSGVLLRDGSKHNGFVGAGRIYGSIAARADPPTTYEGSNTAWVSYMNDPTGFSYTYELCGASELSATPAAGFSHNVGFYAHAAAPGFFYTVGTLRQCWAVGDMLGGHGSGAVSSIETGCHWAGVTLVSRTDLPVTATYSTAKIMALVKATATPKNDLRDLTASDFAWYFQERTSRGNTNPAFQHEQGDVVLENGVIWCGDGFNFNAHCMNYFGSATGTLTVNNCVIGGWTGWLLAVAPGQTYTGDFNVFNASNVFATTRNFHANFEGTDIYTLADWQTATSEDANSVYIKRGDQVAGSPDAFWLAWAEAETGTNIETIGPVLGDFRVNPTAKVYGGDNTVYTGTFADGTTLLNQQAGQGLHWDWNLRQALSGPARRFPRVPVTDAEEEAFITAPDGWVF